MRLIECKDDEIAKLREAVNRQAEELEFLHQRVELDKQTIMIMGQSLEKAAGEVKHGRWEKSQYGGYSVCSACRDVYVDDSWVDNKKWNYCPNCGAKMDKDGDANG